MFSLRNAVRFISVRILSRSGLYLIYLDWPRYNVDTLNICMKEFIIFVCTDSAVIFFPKLRSAGLNYNLPSFFTESYCAGGI